jgi:type IV conjugative transfer system protein TraL
MDDHDTMMLSRLKDPWKFLMLDMDIAMVAVSVGFGAMSMNAPQLVMVGAPAAVAYAMHKFREGRPKGWAAAWRYWHFPLSPSLKRTPASHCHRTIG